MPLNFQDVMVSRELRFSLGVEQESGKHYLSIPVANSMVDYDEYYEIDKEAFERYRADPTSAADFLEQCRNREADDLLILKPGSDRGVPS